MINKLIFSTLLLTAATAMTMPAMARDLGDSYLSKERFQLRARMLGVLPDEDSSVNIGGEAYVGDAITPEVDLTYFITPNIGIEAIAGTAQHKLTYTGDVDIGDTWILPPTITLQYHFMPDNSFNPYIGAGVNYSWFYGEEEGTGFDDLDVEGGFGWALQAGFDYWVSDNWGLNLDVKKIFLNVDADVNLGATPVHADVELDPWIVGAGVSYRF